MRIEKKIGPIWLVAGFVWKRIALGFEINQYFIVIDIGPFYLSIEL